MHQSQPAQFVCRSRSNAHNTSTNQESAERDFAFTGPAQHQLLIWTEHNHRSTLISSAQFEFLTGGRARNKVQASKELFVIRYFNNTASRL
jgi:hypothetical protein